MAKYEGKQILIAECGSDYSDLLEQFGGKYLLVFFCVWACRISSLSVLPPACSDEDRAYAYVRFETGDEMSRRAKFVFITWIGSSVSPLKKAKVSTDKAFVKKLWTVSPVTIRACTHLLLEGNLS